MPRGYSVYDPEQDVSPSIANRQNPLTKNHTHARGYSDNFPSSHSSYSEGGQISPYVSRTQLRYPVMDIDDRFSTMRAVEEFQG